MRFIETRLAGALMIEPEPIEDARGVFSRIFCANEFEQHGLNHRFVQCNLSVNRRHSTLRGMHYQISPHQEVKLVRCARGAIYDVIIDLQPRSPTFKSWFGVRLEESNSTMLYVPEGFAHGYLTLTEGTDVFYQVSQFYTPQAERGVRWNDPAFRIEWPFEPQIISPKDRNWPDFTA